MRDAILAVLTGDAALTGLLTGGIYSAVEISRQTTPTAFDANDELLPCGLLKMETQTPVIPHPNGSRLFFSVMLYERAGYATIDAARKRVYALLQRQKVTPAAGGNWEILHTDDVLDTEDPGLSCCLMVSRFVAYVRR